jgi:hypothetical protein
MTVPICRSDLSCFLGPNFGEEFLREALQLKQVNCRIDDVRSDQRLLHDME